MKINEDSMKCNIDFGSNNKTVVSICPAVLKQYIRDNPDALADSISMLLYKISLYIENNKHQDADKLYTYSMERLSCHNAERKEFEREKR